MAAGDVTITLDTKRGVGVYQQRILGGTVVLDGSNPTPVALASYLREIKGAVVSMEGASAPADDPSMLSSAVTGTTLNIYAWKNTGGTDPTLVASTDNARLVNWLAWGRH